MRQQPVEAVEVVLQALLRVVVRVADDADGTAIAGVADDAEELEIEIARTERQDFLPLFVALANHAVEVQAVQIRLHRRERGGEAVEVIVAVMEIVHDADVRRAVLLAQEFRHGDHVLRFAGPATVIVDRERAASLARALDDGQQLRGGEPDALRVGGRGGGTHHHPDLRMQPVFREKPVRLVVLRPEREVLQLVFLILENLLLERRHMLGAPVVGDLGEAEFRDHLRALGRPALLRIKRHDAPRDQIGAGEKLVVSGAGRLDHETHEPHEQEAGARAEKRATQRGENVAAGSGSGWRDG